MILTRSGWKMSRALLLLVLFSLLGCGGALKLKTTVARVRKPSNVVVLFRVDGPEGPVSDLDPSSFRVIENDVAIPAGDDIEIVRPDLTLNLRLLLLLDFGGRITDFEREAMINSAKTLIATMRDNAQVAVYVFDGSEKPEVVLNAKSDDAKIDQAFERLRTRESKDTSTDMHSALTHALVTLQLESDPPKPHSGMLVLLSRGPDRAGRKTKSDVEDQLDESDMEVVVFVVGVGEPKTYRWLTDNVATVTEVSDMMSEVGKVAQRIDAIARSYYLMSFCSGARAGETKVTIEVSRTITDSEGEPVEQHGSVTERISAEGFGSGCTPWTP
ncbi:VWA domain-containing protein [Desulfobulbus sp. AH-315-M07]|nr:VWA domain-containing protein [Desulfobulbus sp. AH-315-M07]